MNDISEVLDGRIDDLMKDTFEGIEDSPLCPIRWMLDRISSRWALYILSGLADNQPRRFSDLSEAIPVTISNRMLSRTLDELVTSGLVSRDEQGRQVWYQLTELGGSLMVPMGSLIQWIIANAKLLDESRRKFGLPELDLPPGLLD
ncbi:MAG: helix-turn-helix transcriptional regulator [Rhizobiaceae bacterium]|nr:helix-turn-helix transcriptional regulator [Rhizobiaceae bacterium]